MGVSIEFDLYTVKHKVGYLCLCLNKFLVTLSACSLVQDLCQLVPVGILMFTKFFTKSRVGRKIISYGNLGVISFKIAENPQKKLNWFALTGESRKLCTAKMAGMATWSLSDFVEIEQRSVPTHFPCPWSKVSLPR